MKHGLADELIGTAPNDASVIDRGKVVYAEQCARCHGKNLEGQPDWRHPLPNGRLPAPPHDASGHTWHHSDKQLFDMTKLGPGAIVPGYESDMPGFQDKLSDADIWAVLSYIKSMWPTDIRAKQQRMNQTQQRLSVELVLFARTGRIEPGHHRLRKISVP